MTTYGTETIQTCTPNHQISHSTWVELRTILDKFECEFVSVVCETDWYMDAVIYTIKFLPITFAYYFTDNPYKSEIKIYWKHYKNEKPYWEIPLGTSSAIRGYELESAIREYLVYKKKEYQIRVNELNRYLKMFSPGGDTEHVDYIEI